MCDAENGSSVTILKLCRHVLKIPADYLPPLFKESRENDTGPLRQKSHSSLELEPLKRK